LAVGNRLPQQGHGPVPVAEECGDPLSLAGIQLKFSALMESDGGLTIPARGVGGSWIVKLPSARHASVPENEYVMMELAREAGVRVPDTKLVPMGDVAGLPADVALAGLTLAVRRFDRDREGRRIHMEDFAQVFDVFPPDKYETASYENLAGVLWAEASRSDVAEFSRRLAFSALIGNGDMHLKNWSLIYRDGRSAELAPAYDFVSTVPYIPRDRMALSLGGTKDWADVSLDLFRRFAARAGLPESLVVEAARETAGRFVSAWEHHEVVGRLPDAVRSRIAEHIRTVPLSRSA
jgi:serine/threonine-protein kinase HipA